MVAADAAVILGALSAPKEQQINALLTVAGDAAVILGALSAPKEQRINALLTVVAGRLSQRS
jgi:hypothetical protein